MSDAKQYDVFISYARSNHDFSSRVVKHLRQAFQQKVNRQLRIFFDRKSILTSQDWQQSIHSGLQRSKLLVPILSDDYFASKWCNREWDYFIQQERDAFIGHSSEQPTSLIFPIWHQTRPAHQPLDPSLDRRMRDALSRQSIDLSSDQADSTGYQREIVRLASDLESKLHQLKRQNGKPNKKAQKLPGSAEFRESPIVKTWRGYDQGRLSTLLALASNATIIGISDENLVQVIDDSLTQKRILMGPDAFWQSIRFVFHHEKLLPYVNDELTAQFPDSQEATKLRSNRAGACKRRLTSFFIRAARPNQWAIYDHIHILPFAGAIFDMPDGSCLVHMSSSHPNRSLNETLYWEFEDRSDHYFKEATQAIVKDSIEQNEILLLGHPSPDHRKFFYSGQKSRRGAMLDGLNRGQWLPAIIAVTWRRVGQRVAPLLQINTSNNSTREIGKVSHVSGYINWTDFIHGQPSESGVEIAEHPLLTLPVGERAVKRELSEELGLTQDIEPVFFTTLPFFYPDKENLYFYVFHNEIPDSSSLPTAAEIYDWKLDELVRVREHQVIRGVQNLLSTTGLRPSQLANAAEIASLNLILHGHRQLAADLLRSVRQQRDDLSTLLPTVKSLAQATKVEIYSAGRTLSVGGLAGLQYREFFTTLLPIYELVGVPGAAERVHKLKNDGESRQAVAKLSALYHDESVMMSLPIEL